MPELRCPGRSANASLETTLLQCPGCGHDIEIFGDEVRVHCRCGCWVFRDALPSCAQWCSEAARCFGTVGHLPKVLKDTCAAEDLMKQDQRLRNFQMLVAKARAQCPRPEQQKQDGA